MTLWEVLDEINKNPETLRTIYRPARGSALFQIFAYAFIPSLRWKFPDTDPPYTPCDLKAGMTPTDLLVAIKKGRFQYFDNRFEIKQVLREKVFIQLLESIHHQEAKILLAIKDQRLDSLFPNITYDLLASVGYLPMRPKSAKPVAPKVEPKSEAVMVEEQEVCDSTPPKSEAEPEKEVAPNTEETPTPKPKRTYKRKATTESATKATAKTTKPRAPRARKTKPTE